MATDPHNPHLPVKQPFWLPQPHRFTVRHERQHHDEVLYAYGEYAFLILWWNVVDHANGLVERCHCFEGDPIAQAYGQTSDPDCGDCYGTTFEGGIRARVVRPILFGSAPEDHTEEQRRGTYETSRGTLQWTSDVRVRRGDIVVQSDNTRWQVGQVDEGKLQHLFQTPTSDRTIVAWSAPATREDPAAPAYDVPPTDPATILSILDPSRPHFPVDFLQHEEINGPLVL